MTPLFEGRLSKGFTRPIGYYSDLRSTDILTTVKVSAGHGECFRPTYRVRVPKPLYRDMTEARRQAQARAGMRVTPPSPASGSSGSNATKHWTGVLIAKRPEAIGVQWLGEIEYTL
jgi:hypothetical protein